MCVSMADAERQLPDLVRRAEAGEEIVPTQNNRTSTHPEPIRAAPDRRARRSLLKEIRHSAASRMLAEPDAAHSQDFLYGDDGLPM
ncbi:type II toxin-antitoxin system Phd/YefM family antitoxin [Methylorubrum zatmanii]